MKVSLSISRFDPTKDSTPYEDKFEIAAEPHETVLDALIRAWQQDPTISFRRSCRSGICGSCAMSINGRPSLACQTLIRDSFHKGEYIVLEPLPNFRRLKDLVVDMDSFFESLKSILPWLLTRSDHAGLMEPEVCRKVESPATCILCGACDASIASPGTIRPAAMVKSIRLAVDSRDSLGERRLMLAGLDENTLSAFKAQLATVCPKGINLPI